MYRIKTFKNTTNMKNKKLSLKSSLVLGHPLTQYNNATGSTAAEQNVRMVAGNANVHVL